MQMNGRLRALRRFSQHFISLALSFLVPSWPAITRATSTYTRIRDLVRQPMSTMSKMHKWWGADLCLGLRNRGPVTSSSRSLTILAFLLRAEFKGKGEPERALPVEILSPTLIQLLAFKSIHTCWWGFQGKYKLPVLCSSKQLLCSSAQL